MANVIIRLVYGLKCCSLDTPTRQLLCLMANISIRLLYDLKCCSLDIQHVSCDVWWKTLSSDWCITWCVAVLIYNTSAVMFVWWQTLSSDWCMTWCVAVLIYNTSAVMYDGKRYLQTAVWFEVLQSWYTTRQLWYLFDGKLYHQTGVLLDVVQSWYTTHQLLCMMANDIIRLVYYLKCCSLDIQNVRCEGWWQTLSSNCSITWSVAILIYKTSAVMYGG